eukprot:869141-Rhodomonas_salina.2
MGLAAEKRAGRLRGAGRKGGWGEEGWKGSGEETCEYLNRCCMCTSTLSSATRRCRPFPSHRSCI